MLLQKNEDGSSTSLELYRAELAANSQYLYNRVQIINLRNTFPFDIDFLLDFKNFFDSKGINYDVYNADDPKIFKEMLDRNPNARTVPQIFIDDNLIGGYTDLIDKYSE